MKIRAKIDRMVNKGNVKAIASVSLDGMFVVKNLKVMDGKKGLFVSMPQESFLGKDGQKQYSNMFFALTNAAKMDLQQAVLQAYQQQMGHGQNNQQRGQQNYGDSYAGQYQQSRYPEPQFQYPEPQYPDWAGDYGDILPMDLG